MKRSPLLPVFAATLFTSAYLIFSVQPMVSKMLLPMLGGSPSVWNTAMVFFQAILLAGYAYAHGISKYLSLHSQIYLHLGLLALFTMVLPLALPANLAPPEEGGQALWQLGIMLTCIGGPFFVLAASAPLFQSWFAASGHEDASDPYFLYAVSNAGSMIALLGYPLIAEPLFTVSQQTMIWFGGYVALIALTALCGWLIRRGVKPSQPLDSDYQPVTACNRLVWIALSFIPSSLMLGVTTAITTDIASVPFFWIVPLTLYLLTFIIAFSKKPMIDVAMARELTVYALCLVVAVITLGAIVSIHVFAIIVHLAAFFLCAQLCHGELAKLKPSVSHLTEYFLLISVGGVLGGIFNALIAPLIFLVPLEYPLTLAMVGFVIWAASANTPRIKTSFNALEDPERKKNILIIDGFAILVGIVLCFVTFFAKVQFLQTMGVVSIVVYLFVMAQNRAAFAITVLTALLLLQPTLWNSNKKLVLLKRNYFGVVKVFSNDDKNFLYHGTTIHGAQSQDDAFKNVPVAYYNRPGPTGDVFRYMDERMRRGGQKIAALGLGVGSIACYKASGREFDFYEIDSDIADVAQNDKYFSYLSGCGSPYKIILGDARLKIRNATDNSYDLIFIDTFSSDNIPVHVMTKEAFMTYMQKLAPNGIIAMNISNRYFDLRPVLTGIAKDLGLVIYFKYYSPKREKGDISALYTTSQFAVLARNEKTIAKFMEDDGWLPPKADEISRPWTDDYANILSALAP
ncbi:MAG: hypothetical protein DI551_04925 [Micavibrio aeruginosavorus]|uniref:Spermidine synthase n=1 Tax=Micavibrio aeruginosavorus TaxID=349221 RepID=A0A2W5PVQ6_9BACT|nr:MAG: hypothetical protein DI551_04925 [Micavibrio aeruginosavorus]